ncbi:Sorting nexin mvp1 [Naganishia albida]|nr:Sorting nexin mvp1 [Naganishia albida]
MFNTSRTRTTSFPSPFNNLSASTYDPLAASTYMDPEPDPWSGAPTPVERVVAGLGNGGPGTTGSLIADKDVPPQYNSYVDALDTDGSGYISLTSVHRLLSSSGLSATTVERVISMVVNPAEPSVSKQQVYVVLALVGLAQNGQDPTIERLAQTLTDLPIPHLADPDSPSRGALTSPTIETYSTTKRTRPTRGYSTTSSNGFAGSPWGTPGVPAVAGPGTASRAGLSRMGSAMMDAPSTTSALTRADSDAPVNEYARTVPEEGEDASAPEEGGGGGGGGLSSENMKGWWRDLESVQVSLLAEREGWFLQKYKVESDKRTGGTVHRRYSDFVWLLDCLTHRYPFRLLPSLPPKRIGPDQAFLEQRRKGLKRFIDFIANHPVLKEDGAVNVFLTQPGPFEAWRKRNRVNLDEESTLKKLDRAAEMRIPSDLEMKLDLLRSSLPHLVESYAKLVMIAEKAVKRMESAAADQARMAMTLATLSEKQPASCWRCADAAHNGASGGGAGTAANGLGGNACGLCKGVARGLSAVGDAFTREAEDTDRRAKDMAVGNIEMLKQERDLFVAFSQLFLRHDKLSKDSVDALRKRVEVKQKKLASVRQGKKSNWEAEQEKLVTAIEQDNVTVQSLLDRRVFIRHCMYHEMLVLHSRQTGQVTLLARQWARDREAAGEHGQRAWAELGRRLKEMPVD